VLDENLVGREAARKAAEGATGEGPVTTAVEEEMAAVRFRTESAVTPYVGAGLTDPDKDEGPGTTRPVTVEEEKRKPYVGAGIGCDLGGGSRFNLGYRYSTGTSADGTDAQPIDKTDQPPESHDFSFRLKLDF
jgi:opacity protein-like surface antigen